MDGRFRWRSEFPSTARWVHFDHASVGPVSRRVTAVVQGVAEIYTPLFVVDGTQCVGALTIDCARSGIDLLAVSAHKWMLAPAGIGVVHVSDRAMQRIRPDIVGWLSVAQPFAFDCRLDLPTTADRYEPGTENILGILGLDAAVSLLVDVGPRVVEDRILAYTDELCARPVLHGDEIISPRGARSDPAS